MILPLQKKYGILFFYAPQLSECILFQPLDERVIFSHIEILCEDRLIVIGECLFGLGSQKEDPKHDSVESFQVFQLLDMLVPSIFSNFFYYLVNVTDAALLLLSSI